MSLTVPNATSPDLSAPPSPNTLAERLAEFDLPPPSVLNTSVPSAGAQTESIVERLSKLNLPAPEEIRKAEKTGRARRNTDDVTEEIAKMHFDIPEGIRLGRHPSMGKRRSEKKETQIPHTTLQVDDKVLPLPETEPSPLSPIPSPSDA
ncbi:hypothetical protein DACRYDRAFT_113868 [Dacryopinax primogenitus]|uniref:Uncharacterized protein n=1 Tax=Dacryopinax primogenitus (strain DJM 731) TaxID=1858805 RepID=M5GBN8_DACPD|nr:uncharacterized protein DACRYDRAFT_113868 [Dacryopinax primogenitus]EJU05835.1 hypothetical protein DACRYDRAFT_113868 [Dacryopinax primogenitus]